MKRAITALSFVTAAALFAAAGQAQVVISQFYGGGGGSGTYKEDFAVLFNRGTSPVTLTNAGLFYASATGNFTPVATQRVRLPENLTIPAGGSYLVILNDTVGTTTTSITSTTINGNPLVADYNAPTATVLGNPAGVISAAQASGKIALLSNFNWTLTTQPAAFPTASQPTSPGATVEDFIGYGTASASEGSPAPILTNSTFLVRGNVGCDDTNNNSADFTAVSVAVANNINPVRSSQSGIAICGVAVPDIGLTLDSGACGLSSGSSVTLVATATNSGAAVANGASVTITLPSTVSNVAAPGATVAGNVVTWSPNSGTLAASGGSAMLNITATVNSQGTFVATASAPAVAGENNSSNNNVTARNFVAFSGAGYNTAVTPLLAAVPAAYETASGFNAGTIGQVTDAFGTPVKMRSILGRPVASANGSRYVFWTNTEAGDTGGSSANIDGLLVAGSIAGGSTTLTALAAESATNVDPANPARVLRSGVAFPAALTAPAINNAGDFVFATQAIGSGETNPTSVVVKGNVSNPTAFTVLARQGDAASVAGTGVNWGPATPAATTTVFNATTLTNSGTASFTGTLSGTGVTAANDFIAVNGAAVGARKGVTVPTGLAGTNAGAAITSIDASTAAAQGYSVDATGNNVLVSGLAKLAAGTTADDAFVAVNGNVVLQEGFPIAGSGIADNVASFDSAIMQPDGSWYAVGALSTGVDFLVRNGTLLAKTGDVIAPGSTETWSDTVVNRTFTGFASNGNDSVIMGLTSNTDIVTDNVAVWKNGTQSQVLFREGQPVTLNGRQFFVGFVPANRGQSWITADRKFVTLVTLYEGSNVCTNSFVTANLVSALISVDLPATGPSCNNPSNVAGPNQSTTPDASLTADDIIVFLGWFFASDSRANVAGANQSTIPDNSFTADDIIVFLGRYFQGC